MTRGGATWLAVCCSSNGLFGGKGLLRRWVGVSGTDGDGPREGSDVLSDRGVQTGIGAESDAEVKQRLMLRYLLLVLLAECWTDLLTETAVQVCMQIDVKDGRSTGSDA